MSDDVGRNCAINEIYAIVNEVLKKDVFKNATNSKTVEQLTDSDDAVSRILLEAAKADIKTRLEKLVADDKAEDQNKARKYLLEGGRRRRSASKKASKKASKAKAPKAAKKASKKRTKRSSKK
jgi:N-acetylglucosamine kinase-like BadF-type ATPase